MIPAAAGPRIPLTVVSGFLGAGKTTFLNHVLANATGRLAVLVNDFGAVNVDAGLVADHDGQTLRLTNGCICCSLADGFVDTLMRVLAEPFDHIVIEASGVADPWGIAEIALVEPVLRLGAVIALADAERVASLLTDSRLGDTVRRQIEAADIVLLNKRDLVTATQVAGARAAIEAAKPRVPIIETISARVPIDLLDAGDMTMSRPARPKASPAAHEELFRRLLYRRDAPFSRRAVEAALAALPPTLLRLKGRVAIDGEAAPLLLQLVGTRSQLSCGPTGLTRDRTTELVGLELADGRPGSVEAILDDALAKSA